MAALNNNDGFPYPVQVATDSLAVVGQTDWLYLIHYKEQSITLMGATIAGTVAGTFVVEAQMLEGQDNTPGSETYTLLTFSDFSDLPQNGYLSGKWRVRARCSALTSGTYKLSLSLGH